MTIRNQFSPYAPLNQLYQNTHLPNELKMNKILAIRGNAIFFVQSIVVLASGVINVTGIFLHLMLCIWLFRHILRRPLIRGQFLTLGEFLTSALNSPLTLNITQEPTPNPNPYPLSLTK